MTIGPLPMMRTDLMLLSLGIFFYPSAFLFVRVGHSGNNEKTKRCGPSAKLHELSPHLHNFLPRRFPQETHDATFVP